MLNLFCSFISELPQVMPRFLVAPCNDLSVGCRLTVIFELEGLCLEIESSGESMFKTKTTHDSRRATKESTHRERPLQRVGA